MIDYAKPLINIEFMTRVVHDACLGKDYDNAKNVTVELAAEVKLLLNTLTLMIEERDKLEAARRGAPKL